MCSVSPCCSHPLHRPSRSLTYLLSSSGHPSSFLLFLSPLRARVLSLLVVRPRGAYNPTLRRRPRLVVIHTQYTGKHQHCAILRPKLVRISPQVHSLPFSRMKSHRDSRYPYTAVGILNRYEFASYRCSHANTEFHGLSKFEESFDDNRAYDIIFLSRNEDFLL